MKRNPQLLILIGAPGSGKSTFAKYFIRNEENWMRLCRDDFRTMHFTWSNMSEHEEQLITDMIDASIETMLQKQCNVLTDATHCKIEYLNHYIEKFNHLADISFKIFEKDPETLIERCNKRNKETGKYIPAHVVKKYVRELDDLKKKFDFSTRVKTDKREVVAKQDEGLPHAIICDLDGTLSLMNNRNPFDASECDKDELNRPVAEVLKAFAQRGYKILLVSGREDRFREPTEIFLKQHSIPYDELWMRKSADYRKDSLIKRDIYDLYIKDKYFIEFVMDDRNQVVDLWRKDLRITCFQVNYGNF